MVNRLNRRQVLQRIAATTGYALAVPDLHRVLVPDPDPREWTLEAARKVWKPMSRAVQHVGVPGYQWQAAVLWDGALLIGPTKEVRNDPIVAKEAASLGNNLLQVSVGYGTPARFTDRTSIRSSMVIRSLEDGRLPIPHIETRDGDLDWKQVVFAHLFGRTPDQGMDPREDDLLVVHARFNVRNDSTQSERGSLWLHFGDTSQIQLGYKAGVGDELGPSISHRFDSPYGWVESEVRYIIPPPSKGSLRFHEEIAPPQGMEARPRNVLQWEVSLAPGETGAFDLTLPYQAVERSTAEKLVSLDRNRLHRETRRFWEHLLDTPCAIRTPEPFVNDYVAAVPGQMTQQIAYRHQTRVWMYKTSPNHYEKYWPCNAAKALPSLDLRGLSSYTRPVLDSFIATQSEDYGKLTRKNMGDGEFVGGEGFATRPGFLGNFGGWTANTLLLSHGLELWALSSHFRIGRDRAWLGNGPGSPLQAILDACDWIAAQRLRTMCEEDGLKVPHWGLLPAASAHDWLSGNTIFNDAFCIFGMIEAVRLLRETGHPRGEEMARELNSYRGCLCDRYREARDKARPLPLPDGSQIPYVPRDVYELDWTKTDWTYTGYGPLRAGAWGALDPHDGLVNQALAFLEAGMPKGEGFYFKIATDAFKHATADENFRDVNDAAADRHFLWRHYVEYETMWPIGYELFLQRDDLPRFFEWLFHNLSVVLHKDFRVGVESLDGVPSCAPGDGERWRAIRDMFVNERAGYDGSQQSLWLLQAIPRSWLKPGDRLAVKQMGTHFGGHVDLDAEVASNGNSLNVEAKLNLAVVPAEIRVRLRSGNGRRLASAKINGRETPVLERDTIKLPTATHGEFKIVARFA